MAFGAKYTSTFENVAGETLTVKLLKEGYSSPATPIRLGQDPLVREGSKSSSDEWTPLRPQVATLQVHISEEAAVGEVYGSDAEWRLRIEVDGSLDFLSEVRPGLPTRPDDKFATAPYELVANCGLGQLQDKDFAASSGLYTGRRSVQGWISEILRKTGLGLEVATASEWYTPEMDAAPNPLEQEYIDPLRYVEGEGEPWSCYDVLEDLVKGKLAVLGQEGGWWHCYQRALYRADTFDRWVYPSGWTGADAPPSSQTYSAVQQAADPGYIERLSDSETSGREAIGTVHVEYAYGALDTLLPTPIQYGSYDIWTDLSAGGDFELQVFEEGGDLHLDAPTYDGDDTKTVEEILGAGLSLVDAVPVEKGLSVNTEMSVELALLSTDADTSDYLAYVQYELQADSGTTYYLRRQVSGDGSGGYEYSDPQWTTDSGDYVALIVSPHATASPKKRTVEVEAPPTPEAGRLQYHIHGAIDPEPTLGRDEEYRVWTFRTPVDGSGTDQRARRSLTDADATEGKTVDLTLAHGTGPSGAHKAATWIGADASAPLADDWKVAPYSGSADSGLTAAEILAREGIYQLAGRRSALLYTFTEALAPSIVQAIDKGGSHYLPLHTRIDYRRSTTEVKAALVRRDTSIDVDLTQRESTSPSGGDGGGGSDGGGGGASTWPELRGKPGGILSTSGEGATIKPQDAVSSYRPGPVPQGTEVFSRLFISGFGVRGLTIFAGVGPAADYTFSVRLNGAEQATVTLAAGASSAEVSLPFSTTGGDRLSVVGADPRDDDLSDVHATFDISL
jgi:hypothetical protein